MAAYTSVMTGNWSATATWGGSGPPGAGDTATIANGHVVTVDVNTTVGSKVSAAGAAVTINGSSSASYGTLQVATGVTLTLRGYDTTTNLLMLINQYGLFSPQPGSTISGDVASDYGSVIKCQGMIEAVGTSGSHITWTSPSGAYNWSTVVTGEASASQGALDGLQSTAVMQLANTWISNSAGTGPGSMADTSLSITASAHPTLSNPVASVAAIASSGDYYVNHDLGMLYLWWDYTTASTQTVSYTHLTLSNGWGIIANDNHAYEELVFQYCDFSYMGSLTTTNFALQVDYKQSDAYSGSTHRKFVLQYCTVNHCNKFLSFSTPQNGTSHGTSGDPLLITNNTINNCNGDSTYGYLMGSNNQITYLKIDSNTIACRNSCIIANFYGGASDNTGWVYTNNTINSHGMLAGDTTTISYGGLVCSGNTFSGFGDPTGDPHVLLIVGGTSGNPALIYDNVFEYGHQTFFYTSYSRFYNNIVYFSLRYSVSPATDTNLKITNTRFYNNLFIGLLPTGANAGYASALFQTSTNQYQWIDDIQFVNNTIVGNAKTMAALAIGGVLETSSFVMITRLVVSNNLVQGCNNAFLRYATTSSERYLCAPLDFDNNVVYNQTASAYSGFTRGGGRFTLGGANYNELTSSSRNLIGTCLWDSSLTSFSSKTLALTYNSATDRQLTWGGGTAVQLVASSGTCSALSGNTSYSGVYGLYSGVFNDSSQSWTSDPTQSTCPVAYWLVLTGGTNAGQVACITSINSGTQLVTAPAWTNAAITAMSGNGVNPVVCTSPNHGLSTGAKVYVQGASGNTILNNAQWTITVIDANTFSCAATGNGAFYGTASWCLAPDTTTTYAIIKSEVLLTDSASNTVRCGIYIPDFNTLVGSTSDAGIAFAVHDQTGNPNLVGTTGPVATTYKTTAGGSGIGNGTADNAAALDYFGTARPQNGSYDIGFYQTPGATGLHSQLRIRTAGGRLRIFVGP